MTSAPHMLLQGVKTYFYSRVKQALIHSVDGVDMHVNKGEILGIVGESGSGKSVCMLSILGLINAEPGVVAGKVLLQTEHGEKNLLENLNSYVQLKLKNNRIVEVVKDISSWNRHVEKLMKGIRGRHISLISQNPKAALNPFEKIGTQIREAILLHTTVTNKKEAKEKAQYWLEQVLIAQPAQTYHHYPHTLSGGMCQRVMIAMALACEGKLLIADEPTTGLDASIESRILDLLIGVNQKFHNSMIVVSHDLSVIARLANRVVVMYGGKIMESGPVQTLLDIDAGHKHPYTWSLLKSIPQRSNTDEYGYLHAIHGEVIDSIRIPSGCRFYERCPKRNPEIEDRCQAQEPNIVEVGDQHWIRCWHFAQDSS